MCFSFFLPRDVTVESEAPEALTESQTWTNGRAVQMSDELSKVTCRGENDDEKRSRGGQRLRSISEMAVGWAARLCGWLAGCREAGWGMAALGRGVEQVEKRRSPSGQLGLAGGVAIGQSDDRILLLWIQTLDCPN